MKEAIRLWPQWRLWGGVLCCLVLGGGGCRDTASPPLAAASKDKLEIEKVVEPAPRPKGEKPKVGILLVSHGSHSSEWRKMLTDFGDEVGSKLLALEGVSGVKSAFMEYTEPSIATGLKQFDELKFDHVILVPLLLTVSSHSFDDIPTIAGQKEDANSLLRLKTERIESYKPRAKVTMTPLLDFSALLEENLPRRVRSLSKTPDKEGVVLVAYGDETYNDEWESFFTKLEESVCRSTGVAEAKHCWCGHIAGYSREPTQNTVRDVLGRRERVLVIPVLVARDRYFQDQIIGRALEDLEMGDRIAYVPDAILPEPKLNDWVVQITRETTRKLVEKDSHANEGGR